MIIHAHTNWIVEESILLRYDRYGFEKLLNEDERLNSQL